MHISLPELDEDESIIRFWAQTLWTHGTERGADCVVGEDREDAVTVISRFLIEHGRLPQEVMAVTRVYPERRAVEYYVVWRLDDEMLHRRSILAEVLQVSADRVWVLDEGSFLRLQDHPEEGEDPVAYSVLTRDEALVRVAGIIRMELTPPGEMLDGRLRAYADEQVEEHGFDYFLSHGGRAIHSGPYLIFRG